MPNPLIAVVGYTVYWTGRGLWLFARTAWRWPKTAVVSYMVVPEVTSLMLELWRHHLKNKVTAWMFEPRDEAAEVVYMQKRAAKAGRTLNSMSPSEISKEVDDYTRWRETVKADSPAARELVKLEEAAQAFGPR